MEKKKKKMKKHGHDESLNWTIYEKCITHRRYMEHVLCNVHLLPKSIVELALNYIPNVVSKLDLHNRYLTQTFADIEFVVVNVHRGTIYDCMFYKSALTSVAFKEAALTNVKMRYVDFTNVNFVACGISNSVWYESCLSKCNLTQSMWYNSVHKWCVMTSCKLSECIFHKVTFDGLSNKQFLIFRRHAISRNCDFSGSQFIASKIVRVLYTDMTFSRTRFKNSLIRYSKILYADFTLAAFDTCRIGFSSFRSSIFKGAIFLGTKVTQCDFVNCDFREIRTENSLTIPPTMFAGCDFRNADFRGAHLTCTTFLNCHFAGADFTGANLRGTLFIFTDVPPADLYSSFVCSTKELLAAFANVSFGRAILGRSTMCIRSTIAFAPTKTDVCRSMVNCVPLQEYLDTNVR